MLLNPLFSTSFVFESLNPLVFCILTTFGLHLYAALELLLNPYVLLGLATIQPLLEAINVLCVFAQYSDVFIYDFFRALKVCEGHLYSVYVNKGTSFCKDNF
jgi:hypothetical protein